MTLLLPCADAEKWAQIEKLLVGPAADTPEALDALISALSGGAQFGFFAETVPQTRELFDWPSFFAALPALRSLAAELPALFPSPPPLLLRKKEGSADQKVELSRRQAACLLAHSFFGTLTGDERPPLGFNTFRVQRLFQTGALLCPALCFCAYFRAVATTATATAAAAATERPLVFRRHRVEEPPQWKESARPLCEVQFHASGSITDSDAPWHADFANEYIGGGALSGGCAQEEILFAEKPELCACMALASVMDAKEAIVLEGAERYSLTRGYGFGVEFDRPAPPRPDAATVPPPGVLAFDAVVAFTVDQTARSVMQRDIFKAFAAFQAAGSGATIATGNWGAGAFGGDPQLKFLQQWIAASEAGTKTLLYYSFGNPAMAYAQEKLPEFVSRFKTVGDLYNALVLGPTYTHDRCIIDQVLSH